MIYVQFENMYGYLDTITLFLNNIEHHSYLAGLIMQNTSIPFEEQEEVLQSLLSEKTSITFLNENKWRYQKRSYLTVVFQ